MMTISDITCKLFFCADFFFHWGIWRVIRYARISDTTRRIFAKHSLCKNSRNSAPRYESQADKIDSAYSNSFNAFSALAVLARCFPAPELPAGQKFGLLWAGYLNFHPFTEFWYSWRFCSCQYQSIAFTGCATGLPFRRLRCSGMMRWLPGPQKRMSGDAGGGIRSGYLLV